MCNGCLARTRVSITGAPTSSRPGPPSSPVSSARVVLWASSNAPPQAQDRRSPRVSPSTAPAGAWGVIAVGLFADQKLLGSYMGAGSRARELRRRPPRRRHALLGNQILGIVVITLWVSATIGGLFFALKMAGMLRASAEDRADASTSPSTAAPRAASALQGLNWVASTHARRQFFRGVECGNRSRRWSATRKRNNGGASPLWCPDRTAGARA